MLPTDKLRTPAQLAQNAEMREILQQGGKVNRIKQIGNRISVEFFVVGGQQKMLKERKGFYNCATPENASDTCEVLEGHRFQMNG